MRKFYRFSDLKAAGIVSNRMTLSRWIRSYGFPKGILLGPNTRAYEVEAVESWLRSRSQQGDRPDTGKPAPADG